MNIKETILNKMVSHLLQICKKELSLSELPNITLLGNSEHSVDGGASFGQYHDGEITIVTAERHPIDIMRTIAHEIVHWSQDINGEKLDGNTGSEIENTANAVAGVILRKFGKQYPEYFALYSSKFSSRM